MTDENNVNECEIDIIASPIRVKLENVLLSGGEGADGALITDGDFPVSAEPFCVLDEVNHATR